MRRSAAALALASLLLPLGSGMAVGQTAPVPAQRSFQDWIVGCDNTRACVAVGMTTEDGTQPGFVQIARAGESAAAPAVHFVLFDDSMAAGHPMTIAIDGASISGVGDHRPVTVVADFDGFVETALAPGEVGPFIDAVRRGNLLRLTNPAGETAAVSLRGAMAALLFMDEVQGRVGTVTALARPGDRPASTIAAPPAVPVVHPRGGPADTEADQDLATRLRARWAKEKSEECEGRDDSEFDMDDVSPLDVGRFLVAISCSSGAYNYEIIFSIVPGSDVGHARPARFPWPKVDGATGDEPTDRLINGGFDSASGRVGFFSKGRGLGDCGSSGEFAWTGEGFELVSWRVMPECRGVPEAYWPVLWRTDTP